MAAELVRYEGEFPSFTETVADFAAVIHPLVGLSRLVAKVMATRVESERLRATARRERDLHEHRMAQVKAQERVADRHSERMLQARTRQLRAGDRADQRRTALSLHQLELDFDTAMQSIRLQGATRRHEIDRHYAGEIQRIVAGLQVQLSTIVRQSRSDEQVFAQQRQRLKAAEASQAQIRKALSESTRLMGTGSRFTEIAAVTTESLARTLTSMHLYEQDAVAAILGCMARPKAR